MKEKKGMTMAMTQDSECRLFREWERKRTEEGVAIICSANDDDGTV